MSTLTQQSELCSRVRRMRQDRKITQADLAQRAGISLYYLQLLEGAGSTNPSLRVLRRLAKAFDMEVWEFLKF